MTGFPRPGRRSRLRRTLGAAATLAALGAGAAGCSSSDPAGPASSARHTGSGPAALPAPATLAHARGARSALTGLQCRADGHGAWSARGTLRNTTGHRAVFAVDFDVIDTKRGTVHGRAQEKYTLGSGQRATIKIDRFYRGGGAGLTCVPNVRRALA